MISFVDGNLFDYKFDIIVNTVNCYGIMGKGIALEFKKRYPKMFREYRKVCLRKELCPGDIWIWKHNDEWIINFATKDHWRNPSKYSYIEHGLNELSAYLHKNPNKTIGIPPLGCGNGGLDWNRVKYTIIEKLKNVECNATLFNPNSV
jgi:O-acetyl-ADP-ribose deacetylase (regulator of RNase III)